MLLKTELDSAGSRQRHKIVSLKKLNASNNIT